ncbi:eukaryotic translation initiation factor y-chromosomal [Cyclospora cayetanensis]|uniref:Eukaryotic translation initiation factor 4C n=1 Tax=Cyclospora cayetanensis TaxID=88456 RepID=A0A1D3D5L1_9EIME|nr:eukaryotic translation initiation factor y-chromosomal [Cyclospora cayetanensis]
MQSREALQLVATSQAVSRQLYCSSSLAAPVADPSALVLPACPATAGAKLSGKGGKNRRRGKNDNEGEKRELQFKEDGQGIVGALLMDMGSLKRVAVEICPICVLYRPFSHYCPICDERIRYLKYGQVLRMLGNGRLEAHCFDGVRRLCHIRGKMRKRVWVNAGDIVLISLREFQDNKGDVIAKYTPDEARALKSYGELPANAKINETDAFGEEEGGGGGIEFQDSGSDSGSEEEEEAPNNDLDIDDI